MKGKKQGKENREHDNKDSRVGAYRSFLILPMVLLIASVGILAYNYTQTGEWFERSIDLRGGTLVTIKTPDPVDVSVLGELLSENYGQVIVTELRSYSGQGISIQLDSEVDAEGVLDDIRGTGITIEDFSIQTIGPSLGESFWVQAQYAIIIAFILMGIIVFIVFRTFVPSTAVMLAAISDIVVTLAMMQIIGIPLSLASFAALLMLIGYSIDTDILLTTRLIKKTDRPLGGRIRGAFKTGITMTATTLVVLISLLVTTTSPVLFSIAMVLTIGLLVDIINTWMQNATLLRWHCERRGLL